MTDTGSYSDLVFGLAHLLGKEYRPALADLPDQKLWRTDRTADYGALDHAARGRLDIDKIRMWWPDILRLVASHLHRRGHRLRRGADAATRRTLHRPG